MGMLVTTHELAEFFGVVDTTITRWISQGLPVAEEGGPGRGNVNLIDTERAVAWRIAQVAHGGESPKDRLDRIRADREELALARDLEEVAPVVLMEKLWRDHIAAARTELLGMADELASELSAIHGINVDADLILRHVEAALRKLESYDCDPDSEQSDLAAEDDGDGAEDAEADD